MVCAQLRLVLWKNWILKKRRCMGTLIEIAVPVMAIALLILLRDLIKVEDQPQNLLVNQARTVDEDAFNLVLDAGCGYKVHRPLQRWRFPFDGDAPTKFLYKYNQIAFAPARDDAQLRFEVDELMTSVRDSLLGWIPYWPTHINCTFPCNDFPWSVLAYNYTCPTNERFEVKPYVHDMFRLFPTAAELETYVQSSDYDSQVPTKDTRTIFAAVIVDTTGDNWDYTLRTNWTDLPYTGQQKNTLEVGYEETTWAKYYEDHIIYLKHVIDRHIITKQSKVSAPGIVSFLPFPIPAHKKDNFRDVMGNVSGLFLIMSFMWPFSRLVRNLVEEKERKIKEGMKMMGLANSMYWMSWGLTYLVMFTIMSIAATLISMPSLFHYSDPSLVFLFFFSFSLSLITAACLMTTFFARAKTAGTLSPFLLFLAFLPFFSVSDPQGPIGTKNLASLLSPVAMALGTSNILSWESAFIGIQWNNAGQATDNYKMSDAIFLMFFDALLYGFISWYVDHVIPKEYGTNKPWYFLCTGKYWRSCCPAPKANIPDLPDNQTVQSSSSSSLLETNPHGAKPTMAEIKSQMNAPLINPNVKEAMAPDFGPDYEAVPDEMEANIGVITRKLRKVFTVPDKPEPFVAVDSLDMNLYTGQIFVLLGHNGAGKSTTINMLTGMLPPSDGTSKMFGYDINQDMNTIRTFMGVCPQHDVLFDSLTVKEHLEFFGRLKKVPEADLARVVSVAISEVQLDLETNKESCQLSGGQKRRLSLAIALIGDSRIVFLDEPTSGVDPFSRRAIWDLLARKKDGRVIVLTTHFMDEADQLGDRIGILHGGKMKCCGSALFLKRKFGVGYNMVVTKDRNGCDEEALQKLVTHHVASADKLSSVGSEVVFRLPLAATGQFPELLSSMDENKQRIGVVNYGLSVTTLEEVFIKVATNRDEKEKGHDAKADIVTDKGATDDLLTADPSQGTFCRHFNALFWKRWHITKRDRRQQCCQFLAPLIMLVIGFYLLHIPPNADFPSLVMEPSAFDHPNYVAINRANWPEFFTHNIDADTATFDTVVANTLEEFQLQLLDHRLHNQQSRYGAFFRDNTTTGGLYSYTVATNISGLHAMPIFQNIANTAILRNLTGNPKASITTRMHPFAWTQSEKKFIEGFNGVFASIVISFAFAFIPAGFAVFIVLERERQCKHLQMISGVSNISYWVANYAWDMVNFLIPAALSAGVVYAYGNENFVGDNFQVICLQFFLYGLAVIPFTYCASFLFASHSTAQNVMILVYVVGGVMLTMVDFALSQIDSTKDANDRYIRHLFRLIPNFCLGDTIFWMSLRSLLRMSKWDLDISGNDSIFLAWEAIAYFILAIAIDYLQNIPSFVALFKADPVVKDSEDAEPLDIDVADERQRVSSGAAHSDNIQVKGLRKTYARGGLPAQVSVKDVWFGIPAGECFGFLGVNGAGKTTTLKMLTGDVIPTSGGALLGGFNIASQPVECRRLMGYCPQFDALHELLTATETLEMYGRIRGIPERNLSYMVSYLVDRLDLKKYANRPAGTYSGGNRRKLSVAIALIGNPKVVFLDEPSTGMDPVARRFMWDFLNETMASRAVILTTHSMEECEALCNRIGILVAGELKCLGTSQHLKNRFGKGFQIDISTAGNNPEKAREFITREFKSCEEIECYGGKIKYKLHEAPGLTLRSVFSLIERNKVAVGISEYSVGQTTLEQLFINFARKGEQDKHLEAAGGAAAAGHQHVSVGVVNASGGSDQKMRSMV